MNKTVKIILIIIGIFFLLGLGVCGAGYLWLDSNMGELKAEGERLQAEAAKFAQSSDQEGCIKETLSRIDDACEPGDMAGAVCRGKHNVFFNACIEAAKPTTGF